MKLKLEFRTLTMIYVLLNNNAHNEFQHSFVPGKEPFGQFIV